MNGKIGYFPPPHLHRAFYKFARHLQKIIRDFCPGPSRKNFSARAFDKKLNLRFSSRANADFVVNEFLNGYRQFFGDSPQNPGTVRSVRLVVGSLRLRRREMPHFALHIRYF